jgi:hypothetical protein
MIANRSAVLAATVLALGTMGAGAASVVRARSGSDAQRRTVTRVSLVAVLFPECGCNDNPAFPKALASIKDGLRKRAVAAGVEYADVGVGFNRDVAAGLAYLLEGKTQTGAHVELGQWDEVHAGGSWRNEVLLNLIWRERLADASIPQILLIERELELDGGRTTRLVATRRTLKLIGTSAFEAWVAGGMVLPDSSALASR